MHQLTSFPVKPPPALEEGDGAHVDRWLKELREVALNAALPPNLRTFMAPIVADAARRMGDE